MFNTEHLCKLFLQALMFATTWNFLYVSGKLSRHAYLSTNYWISLFHVCFCMTQSVGQELKQKLSLPSSISQDELGP